MKLKTRYAAADDTRTAPINNVRLSEMSESVAPAKYALMKTLKPLRIKSKLKIRRRKPYSDMYPETEMRP